MRRKIPWLLFILGGALSLGACDEDIVYVERDVFGGVGQPVQAAQGFVGYSDPEAKLTVCGNCHVGQQSVWEETAHADAWVGLQAAGSAQAFCEGCHTVNSLGNDVEAETGGWFAVKEERYHDVQCESCHGAGLPHIQNPDAGAPMAAVAVEIALGADGAVESATGCGECHTGTHHPFVEEWALSAHGQVPSQASPGGREACAGCHTGENALRMFGVKADYDRKEELLNSTTEHLPITCAVCHDPHDNTYEGQLRFPVQTTNIEEHLCAQCHNRRTEPAPGSGHGLEPHAPESALLVGEAGFFFAGMEDVQGEIYGTHGPGGNPRLCATCHVNNFEVVDEASGNLVFNATGHLFNAIPCVDAQGRPLPRDQPCAVTPQARSFQGCTASGCHATEQAASSALRTAALRLQTLADELHELLERADPNLLDEGGAINPADQTITVAEGAFFNLELALFRGAVESITGEGNIRTWGAAAHNPFLMEQLLLASIREVRREYAPSSTSRVDLTPQLQRPARLPLTLRFR